MDLFFTDPNTNYLDRIRIFGRSRYGKKPGSKTLFTLPTVLLGALFADS